MSTIFATRAGAAQRLLGVRVAGRRYLSVETPARSKVFIEVSIGGNDPQRMTIEVSKFYRAAMSISSL